AAETGAAPMWAHFNCRLGANMLREAAALTTQVTGEIIPSDKPGLLAMAVRQPAGVVVGIAPWNAPVILGVRALATPLACGNTVVLKSAETCPRTHWLIADTLRAAGLPAGVLNVVGNAPADELEKLGSRIVSGGTDNHLLLVDLRPKNITGKDAATALNKVGITVNKNLIPFDPQKPTVTSGVRIGTPAVTSRGMKEEQMRTIAQLSDQAVLNKDNDAELQKIRKNVHQLTKEFPIYEEL
ncbi:MAG: aldehyde dehydrogenase family protein, partial [Candidatus Omnitrophica bacterium]|nr:aldehyde dehydrogenase family protein [Candidatus Omnitrophota bacterium]